MVTRTREQSSTLAASLRELGAEVLEVPTIQIAPPESYVPLDRALARIAQFDTLLVTSANTARVLAERKPVPWDAQPFTVAIGPATAETLRGTGLRVHLQPMPAIAESVVRELAPSAKGKQMLLARAAVARDLLPDALRTAGASVEIVDAYRTVLAENSRPVLEKVFAPETPRVDAVAFTSSSTVKNFFALLGLQIARQALRRSQACSIGPMTSATLRDHGIEPATEARAHDVVGLLTALRGILAR